MLARLLIGMLEFGVWGSDSRAKASGDTRVLTATLIQTLPYCTSRIPVRLELTELCGVCRYQGRGSKFRKVAGGHVFVVAGKNQSSVYGRLV